MRKIVLIALVGILGSWTPVAAQANPLEVSVDGGFALQMLDNQENITYLTVPLQQFRVAAGLSPQLSLEGKFRFNYESQGDFSGTRVSIAPGLAYHFNSFDRESSRPYVGAFTRLAHVSSSSGAQSGGDTQFGFGGSLGLKRPFARAGFVRLEAVYTHYVESDLFVSSNTLGLTVGLGAILN